MSSAVLLVTGGYDNKIRFWDATSGACTRILSCTEAQPNCLALSLDKTLLAVGSNPHVLLFDVNSDDKPISTFDAHTNNVTAVGFQQDQKWLYSGSEDSTVRVWDPRSNQTVRRYECSAAVNSVVLHPSEVELISGDQSGMVRVWDIVADKMREEISPLPDVAVRSISISIDGSFLTVGSHRGRVFVYNLFPDRGMELSREFQAHDDYLLKCLISNDMRTLATTSSDKTIKIWNTATWEVDRVLNKHQKWVWDCVFSADSMYLLSASSDMCAKLWDMRTGEVARNYIAQNNTLAFTCVALNDISIP